MKKLIIKYIMRGTDFSVVYKIEDRFIKIGEFNN